MKNARKELEDFTKESTFTEEDALKRGTEMSRKIARRLRK
ncbi:Uncharacterised protein [uncultured archaeon]|nr:Uncharacterised protein [uncultured archaeon]